MRTHLGSRQLRLWVTLAFVFAAGALLASCGDDGDADEDDAPQDTPSTTTTTQPVASDEDAAFPIVEDVVTEATSLADALFQNPAAVDDPENEDLARLRQLYTEDSVTPDGVVDQLRELVDKGQRERPAANGIFRDLGIYRMTAVDDDTIRFRVCAVEDTETVDQDDKVVARTAQVVQGVGEARRVDGVWRFYGVSLEEDRTLPIAPGSAEPGFCDTVFAEAEAEADES